MTAVWEHAKKPPGTRGRKQVREAGNGFRGVVQTRRSVRGFKDKPVPKTVIEEILDIAKRAPSSMNTQPWHVHVLTGEPLEQVRRRNMEEMVAGAKPKRDIVSHGEYQGVHRQRQVDIAKKLFGAMGIARDDRPMRQDWVLRGFRQFDAPVSLVLAYDRVLDPGAVCHFDLGALCYGIVLAAWDRGLGTVINGRELRARTSSVRSPASLKTGHHDLRCHGLSGRFLPGQWRAVRPEGEWGIRPVCRLCRVGRGVGGDDRRQCRSSSPPFAGGRCWVWPSPNSWQGSAVHDPSAAC